MLTLLPAVSKILELPENVEVAVVGTVYKEMKLKPSILSEYNKVSARVLSATVQPHLSNIITCL